MDQLRVGLQLCGGELGAAPRGTACGGAHDEVGNAVGLAQSAACGRGVAPATRGKWSFVVCHVVGPGGLGVPQHDQAPGVGRCHGVSGRW